MGGHTDTAYNGTINFSNITSIDGVGDAWVTEVNAIYYADIKLNMTAPVTVDD